MSETIMKEFDELKDKMPLQDIFVLAKYGFNTRRVLKQLGVDPEDFMEMITCQIKKP